MIRPLATSLAALLALVLFHEGAHAVIRTDVEACLGIRVPAPDDPEGLGRRLAAAGLELRVTPSITYGGREAKSAWYAVKVLGAVPVDRDADGAASFPVPTAAEVEQVEKALATVGLRGDLRIWLLVQQTGGR